MDTKYRQVPWTITASKDFFWLKASWRRKHLQESLEEFLEFRNRMKRRAAHVVEIPRNGGMDGVVSL